MQTETQGAHLAASPAEPLQLPLILLDEAEQARAEARAELLRQAAMVRRQVERRLRRNFMARLRYARKRDAALPGPTLPGILA